MLCCGRSIITDETAVNSKRLIVGEVHQLSLAPAVLLSDNRSLIGPAAMFNAFDSLVWLPETPCTFCTGFLLPAH
jgi:hypothetical protein